MSAETKTNISADSTSEPRAVNVPDSTSGPRGGVPASKVDFVSLKDIVHVFNDLMDSIPLETDPTIIAFRATLQTLHGLWHLPNAEWREARKRIYIGLIKATKKHGNTSVSMGFAARYFKDHPEEKEVSFLNCGTGGIKYQYYRNDDCIYVDVEHKPENGASPSRLNLTSYKPKKPMGENENTKALNSELSEFIAKIQKKHPEYDSKKTLYAFITGTVREHWEKQNFNIQLGMDFEANAFFNPESGSRSIQKLGKAFFLPQEEEGRLEVLGTSRMYMNLGKAKIIPQGAAVIGSFGIGRGSVQDVFVDPNDDDTIIQYNYTNGMNNPEKLVDLPWSAIPGITPLLPQITAWANSVETPIIALKSGCMLWLESPDGEKTRAIMSAAKSVVGPVLTIHPILDELQTFARATNKLFTELASFTSSLPVSSSGNSARNNTTENAAGIVHDSPIIP